MAARPRWLRSPATCQGLPVATDTASAITARVFYLGFITHFGQSKENGPRKIF